MKIKKIETTEIDTLVYFTDGVVLELSNGVGYRGSRLVFDPPEFYDVKTLDRYVKFYDKTIDRKDKLKRILGNED